MRRAPPTQADAMRLLDHLFALSPIDDKLIAAVIDRLADRDPSMAMTVIELLLDEAGKRLPEGEREAIFARVRRAFRAPLAAQGSGTCPSSTTAMSFPSPSRAVRLIRPLLVMSADQRRSALASKPHHPDTRRRFTPIPTWRPSRSSKRSEEHTSELQSLRQLV